MLRLGGRRRDCRRKRRFRGNKDRPLSPRIAPGAHLWYCLVVRDADNNKVIYWHRDLPPLEAEPVGAHIVEATSMRVNGDLEHRTQLWDQCYEDLMAHARDRLSQELMRLGGDYAHVLEESVDSRRDDVTGEAWLHGRFSYMLLKRPTS